MAQGVTTTGTDQDLRRCMTYEEFLNSAFSEAHAEWVDGEVTIFMPPTERHADVTLFLSVLLALYVRAFGHGKVFAAPFEMRMRADRSFREPDLLFVAREHFERLDGNRLNGPADLVIEVISATSIQRDRVTKFAEYQEAGVPEYLLVDVREGADGVDLYRLDPEGTYRRVGADGHGRIHVETIPGLWFDPDWLRQDPLPDPLQILTTIAPERF